MGICKVVFRENIIIANFYFTYLLAYEDQPFLRSCQLCSYSRTYQDFFRTRRFIAVFTSALHWSLS
jgi:hypothetical protein